MTHILLLLSTFLFQTDTAFQRHTTRYLSLDVPQNWKKDTTLHAENMRFDSPEGFFVAALSIGAYEKNRWKTLQDFVKAYPGRYKSRTINNTVWGEDRRTTEGSVEINLVTLYKGEIIQVLINYEDKRSSHYAPLVKRIIESLSLPQDNK